MPPKAKPKKVTTKRSRAPSKTVENKKRRKVPLPSKSPPKTSKNVSKASQPLSPLTADPQYVTETFSGTLKRLKEATPKGKFGLPQWVVTLIETAKQKGELVAKQKEFKNDETQQITEIYKVIKKFIRTIDDVFLIGKRPDYYTVSWNKTNLTKDSDGRLLIGEFLRDFLCNKPVKPNKNALICCAVMLLDLSCVWDDFAGHVRNTCRKEIFGCCVITNDLDQLRELSGKFVKDKSTEMQDITSWANGECRVGYTLSIGGESGSGKTRAALQCAKLIKDRKEDSEADKDYLTVYIKLSKDDNQDLLHDKVASYFPEPAEGDAAAEFAKAKKLTNAKAVDRLLGKGNAPDNERNVLRVIRARLCYEFVRRKIFEITEYSVFKSKKAFKQVFFVFDEAGICPWVYRSVNQVSSEGNTLAGFFNHHKEFSENFKVVCCSTASEAVFRNMLSTQGSFFPVMMHPCREVYDEMVKSIEHYGERKRLLAEFLKNTHFEQLVQNRRCGVFAAEAVIGAISYTNLGKYPVELADEDLPDKEELLLSETDKEGVYSIAGFIVCVVVAQYKMSNGGKNFNTQKMRRLAATTIRTLLCCPRESLRTFSLIKDPDVIQTGMLGVITTPVKVGSNDKKLLISVSAAQLVMAATNYGGRSLLTMNASGGSFEVFSAALFSLYLDGYSRSYYEAGKYEESTISAFLQSVSATTLVSSTVKVIHTNVAPVMFAKHQIAGGGYLKTASSELKRLVEQSAESAFVIVNCKGANYADLMAKSGDVLYLLQCKASRVNPTVKTSDELLKMGFSVVVQESPGKTKTQKKTPIETKPTSDAVNTTKSLLSALGCTTAVPVFVCTEPKSHPVKEKLKSAVQIHHAKGFGWDGPAALLYFGRSIEQTTIISV